MRTILFRGKRIDNGAWVEGDLMTNGSMRFISWIENVREHEDVIPETVGQFTGLLDKNGKKIFEGDLVSYYQPYAKRTDNHIVCWDDNWSCFGLFEIGNKWCKENDWMKIQDIEVIGNIHDK